MKGEKITHFSHKEWSFSVIIRITGYSIKCKRWICVWHMAKILQRIAKELLTQMLITEAEYKVVLREIEKGEKQ